MTISGAAGRRSREVRSSDCSEIHQGAGLQRRRVQTARPSSRLGTDIPAGWARIVGQCSLDVRSCEGKQTNGRHKKVPAARMGCSLDGPPACRLVRRLLVRPINRQAFVNPVDVVSICRVALDFRAWATPNNRWQSSNGLVGHIPRVTAPLHGSAATLREGPSRCGPSRIEPMARRRMDAIRRTDRTYYFIRPPDEPSVPRRKARVKIDYDRELRDLANKGRCLIQNARRVQCGRPTAQTMR